MLLSEGDWSIHRNDGALKRTPHEEARAGSPLGGRLAAATKGEGGEGEEAEGGGLGDGGTDHTGIDAEALGEGGEELEVLGIGRTGIAGIGLVEVGGQGDEVGDGDLAIVIHITFLPGAG